MNKLFFLTIILCFSISKDIFADGGALGLQLGRVTFGIGGSSNGPIIGVGPSPDNGLPIAVPFVPGGSCCDDNYNYKRTRRNRNRNICRGCDSGCNSCSGY